MKKICVMPALLMVLISSVSFAGSRASGESQFQPEEITRFAKQVEKYAAAQGARVFIIGRAGRPQKELPEGIEFTHTAIAIYSNVTLPDGKIVKGYAIHNLYQTEHKKDRSELVTDYPLDFFWNAQQLRSGIIIPTKELQQRLIEAYATGVNQHVHIPKYSVLANPYNAEFQNCTEYTLDVINAAIYQTTNYGQLKKNTKAHFKAQKIKIGGLKILLGSLLMEDLKTTDHSAGIVTATMGSIGDYLAQNKLLDQAVTIEQDGQVNPMMYGKKVLAAR